jgi:hypothetical protein
LRGNRRAFFILSVVDRREGCLRTTTYILYTSHFFAGNTLFAYRTGMRWMVGVVVEVVEMVEEVCFVV